jgi:signal transduction histidine kinase
MENAIKYNVPGGWVRVTTRWEGERICLEVSDTGVGIPETDRNRIFERFYRVDKARSRDAGGTGLGLSIVRDTVRLYGGTISVAPNEPAGTTFTVLLPVWTEEEGMA